MVINKLHSNYLIKRCREKPDLIQNRLDRIASTILLEEVERKLSKVSENDAFLFVKNISVDFKVDFSKMDDRAVASLWADLIGSKIEEKIEGIGEKAANFFEDESLAVFPSKASHYAYFIRDIIDGVAWKKWYYKEFEGMQLLDKQEIFKLIFKQAKVFSEDVLLFLFEIGSLEKFLQTLTEENAKEIFLQYLKKSAETTIKLDSRDYDAAFDKVSEFVHSLDKIKNGVILGIPASYKTCLKVYAFFKREYSGFGLDIYTRRIIEDIIFSKKTLAQEEKLKTQKKITSEIINEDEKFSFTSIKENTTEELLEEKLSEEKTFEVLKEFVTLYGGLFFLIPAVTKIRLEELILKTGFPEKNNLCALNYFLFFLGIKITGEKSNILETLDPVIPFFSGLNEYISFNTLKNIGNGISREVNEDFTDNLLKKLKLMEEQSSPYLDYVVLDDLKRGVDMTSFDSIIGVIANLILKVFARDLRGFEKSSHKYLLRNFIEREAKVRVRNSTIYIKLAEKPLDTVLRLSGLLDYDIRVPWLENRKIQFALG
ncbi:MAG: hypothetical protein P8Z50_01005 [candidate division WOR-3 bacterium]